MVFDKGVASNEWVSLKITMESRRNFFFLKNKCTNQSSNDDYNEPRLGFYNKYTSKPKMSLWAGGRAGV